MSTCGRRAVVKFKPPAPPRVYVDSCVYLDLIIRNEGELHADTNEPRWRSAKQLFDAVNQDRVRLAASALVEAEVCCNGRSRHQNERVRALLAGWFTALDTDWTDVDRPLARRAAQLGDDHSDKREPGKHFGSADAVHLAAAIRLRCDYLVTHDGGFPIGHKIEGVAVIRPRQVWEGTLFDELSQSATA